MLSKFLLSLPLRSAALRRFFWKRSYQYLAARHQDCSWTFMNYGFVPDDELEPLKLEESDERDRYCIQLYHHVATLADIEGLDVLEVSSGRGGGASWVQRYLRPRSMTGLDFSPNAVQFCRRCHRVERLSFRSGDAEQLPFDDASFDVVINVEASHCYGSMGDFLAQVARVLRPAGKLLYADFRFHDAIDGWSRELERCALTLAQERDITSNVLRALELDSPRKKALIDESVGPMLRQAIEEFAALEGSRLFESFKNRERIYKSFLLRK